MNAYTPSARSRVRRLHERGSYDVDAINAILDAGLIAHVGYVIDGQPFVTPTAYWREGEHVYWHGSSASRMLRTVREGVPVCLTVTHLDGLVLARSGFHHSMNYRSAMLFGRAEMVEDPSAKERALDAFVDRIFPGRQGRAAAADAAGAEGHDGGAHDHRGGLGQGAHRPAQGRRGGLCAAGLGGRTARQAGRGCGRPRPASPRGHACAGACAKPRRVRDLRCSVGGGRAPGRTARCRPGRGPAAQPSFGTVAWALGRAANRSSQPATRECSARAAPPSGVAR